MRQDAEELSWNRVKNASLLGKLLRNPDNGRNFDRDRPFLAPFANKVVKLSGYAMRHWGTESKMQVYYKNY